MDSRHRTLSAITGMLLAGSSIGCTEAEDPPEDAWMAEACQLEDATIGRCVLVDSGAPCAGALDEQQRFEPFGPGGDMPFVVGPQGASMFVLAVRTTGIHPGDPNDPASPENPDVTMSLTRGDGERVALYRGRPYFADDATEPSSVTALGLFVIMEGAHELIGEVLEAQADIVDRDGVARCGTASITVEGD